MKNDEIILTPDSANQIRKEFTVQRDYLVKPQIMSSITQDQLTVSTIGVFGFLTFLIVFFLIAETIKSLGGTS